MPLNPFFNNFADVNEQRVWENLVIESIQIYGHNVYYLPRTRNNYDKLYGADDISSFDAAHQIEVYISNVEGFEGPGHFYSRIAGMEERDRVTLIIARRTFDDLIGTPYGFERPREGDLIWVPMIGWPFEIRYVEKFKPFYQMGNLPMYTLTCEKFEYAQEAFNTGVPEIDAIQMQLSLNYLDWAYYDEDGNALLTEDGDIIILESFDLETILPAADNEKIQDLSDDFLDFSEIDPLSGGDGTY